MTTPDVARAEELVGDLYRAAMDENCDFDCDLDATRDAVLSLVRDLARERDEAQLKHKEDAAQIVELLHERDAARAEGRKLMAELGVEKLNRREEVAQLRASLSRLREQALSLVAECEGREIPFDLHDQIRALRYTWPSPPRPRRRATPWPIRWLRCRPSTSTSREPVRRR
jgi:hypothetical protein